MPGSQRLRYEFAPLRAGGADDEDFHDPRSIRPQKSPQIPCLWTGLVGKVAGPALWGATVEASA
jgi:hypothetical protein